MAGLGRGIGSLISESNNKKAKQQEQNAKTLGQSLLERSLNSQKIAQATDANTQAKVDNESLDTASKSTKTSSSTLKKVKAGTKKATTPKTTQAKTNSKKTSTRAKAKAQKEPALQEQAPQEPALGELAPAHAPTHDSALASSDSPKRSKSSAKKKVAHTVDAALQQQQQQLLLSQLPKVLQHLRLALARLKLKRLLLVARLLRIIKQTLMNLSLITPL